MTHAILLTMVLAGCGDKEPKSTAAPAQAAAKPSPTSTAPADATSQQFVSKLTSLDIKEFHPSSSQGGKIEYGHLKFRPEGVWAATGFVEASDEKMDCSETGTWTMEPAVSESTATMTWKTDKTDCAGRVAGTEQRVEVTIKDDDTLDTRFR